MSQSAYERLVDRVASNSALNTISKKLREIRNSTASEGVNKSEIRRHIYRAMGCRNLGEEFRVNPNINVDDLLMSLRRGY